MLIDICIKFREKSLSGFQVIERTRFVTDRQTDRLADRRPGKNNMSPDPEGGDINSTVQGITQYGVHNLLARVGTSLGSKTMYLN